MGQLFSQLSNFSNWKVFFLFFVITVISPYSLALEYREKLKATVVRVSPSKSRFIIDRGTEDGIIVKDMARFILNKKFLCVALAINATEEFSEWMIYRSYAKSLISENTTLNLISLYGVDKPQIKNLAEVQSTSLMTALKEEHERIKNEEQEAKRKQKESVLLRKYALERYKNFPLPNLQFQFNASPLSFESRTHSRYLNLGAGISNVDQKNYKAEFNYQVTDIRYTNVLPTNNHEGKGTFAANKKDALFQLESSHFFGTLDSYSQLSYHQDKDGEIYIIHDQIDLGFLGVKWTFYPHFLSAQISLIYLPLIEFYSADQISPTQQISSNGESQYTQMSDNYWRHGFFMNAKVKLGESVQLENLFSVRPLHDWGGRGLDFEDNDLKNLFKVIYSPFSQLSFSFDNEYSWDIRREKNLDIGPSEWKNTIQLHYNFELKNLFF